MNTLPPPKITLIQLIGGQTQPNIVGIKAVRPDKVISLYTDKTKKSLQNITNFIKEYLPGIILEDCLFTVDFPSIKTTRNRVATLIKNEKKNDSNVEIVINYTGGTKLMSIGAFLAGVNENSKKPEAPTVSFLYVEDAEHIKEGEESQESTRWKAEKLPLEELLAAQGVGSKGTEAMTSNRLRIAKEILKLRSIEDKKSLNHFTLLSDQDNNPKQLRENFNASLPTLEQNFINKVEQGNRKGLPYEYICALCAQEGWLEEVGGHYVFAQSLKRTYRDLEQANNFLNGGWWELLVADTLKQIVGEENVRWSFTDDEESMEDDVVAVIENHLLIISCKSGYDRKRFKTDFHRLRSRAGKLGGSQAKYAFATYAPLTPDLRDSAEALGIPVIRPQDLHDINQLKATLGIR